MTRPSRVVLAALLLGCLGPLLFFLRATPDNYTLPSSSYPPGYTASSPHLPFPVPAAAPSSPSPTPLSDKALNNKQFFWGDDYEEQQSLKELAEEWANSTWTEELPFILFIHVPKTAGSSFKQLLSYLCDESGGIVHHVERFEFLGWSAEKQNSFCGLYGHFGIGIAEQEEWKVDKPAAYVTFLRDPVSRMVSQYNYGSNRNPKYRNLTLDQFITAKEKEQLFGPWSCINPATGQLSRFWHAEEDELHEPLPTREDLRRAKARLTAPMEEGGIELLGLVERYEDSIRMMEFKLGRRFPRDLVGMQTNKSQRPTDIHVSDLSDAQLRRILRMSELDLELYEFGKKVFEARYAAMKGRILHQDYAWQEETSDGEAAQLQVYK
ncbi:hypothetical protein QOT17_021215 [Balamuthia mandrillaris]